MLESCLLLIVLSCLQEDVLYAKHDSGYLGQLNTYLHIKKSFNWYQLHDYV